MSAKSERQEQLRRAAQAIVDQSGDLARRTDPYVIALAEALVGSEAPTPAPDDCEGYGHSPEDCRRPKPKSAPAPAPSSEITEVPAGWPYSRAALRRWLDETEADARAAEQAAPAPLTPQELREIAEAAAPSFKMNDDPEWLRKKTEQEDGCDVSVGGIPTVRCAWCGGELLNRNAAQAPLDRTRPEGAYVTQILPDELSAAAGQRPRYKLEHVVGDCTVSSITVTEDEARSVQHAIAALIAKENAG